MNITQKIVDLILPGLIIVVATILLCLGINGEVKGILAMAALWAFRGVATEKIANDVVKKTYEALKSKSDV